MKNAGEIIKFLNLEKALVLLERKHIRREQNFTQQTLPRETGDCANRDEVGELMQESVKFGDEMLDTRNQEQ